MWGWLLLVLCGLATANETKKTAHEGLLFARWAPKAKIFRDPVKYKCRREPMPQTEWNTLARNSKTRLACPIGCEPNSDLSVLQKRPYHNPACQKYYTYGKYRDEVEGEWYLWLTEPCVANITTHCRFKDIPHPQVRLAA